MTHPIAALTIVVVLLLGGCGGGCGRETRQTPTQPPQPVAPTTLPPAPADAADPVGQNGEMHRLYRPRRWEVGELTTSDVSTATTGRMTEVAPDGELTRLPTVREKFHGTWVEKVADVDAEGNRTRYLVDMRAWLRTHGSYREDAVDETSIAVSGAGSARRWQFVGQEPQLSAEAKNWLDTRFGTRGLSDEQWLRAMLPDDDKAVGASWTPKLALLADEMSTTGLTIDRAGVAATVRLDAVEDGTAVFTFSGRLPLLRFPNTDDPWTQGGMMAFEGEMAVPLEPEPLFLAALYLKATLRGETNRHGTAVRYDFVSIERRTTSRGGDFRAPSP